MSPSHHGETPAPQLRGVTQSMSKAQLRCAMFLLIEADRRLAQDVIDAAITEVPPEPDHIPGFVPAPEPAITAAEVAPVADYLYRRDQRADPITTEADQMARDYEEGEHG
jgi:hypothetical protein